MQSNVNDFFDKIKGKKIAFCGIGISNLPLIKLFREKGAIVTTCDAKNETQLADVMEQLKPYGVKFKLGENYLQNLAINRN